MTIVIVLLNGFLFNTWEARIPRQKLNDHPPQIQVTLCEYSKLVINTARHLEVCRVKRLMGLTLQVVPNE